MSDEDTRLGAALVTLLRNLGLLPDANLIPEEPGYITMFAWVAHHRNVPERQTLLGFAWAWLENQLAVACKALPLGPILPGLALGSALHETQYSRLFRS